MFAEQVLQGALMLDGSGVFLEVILLMKGVFSHCLPKGSSTAKGNGASCLLSLCS